MICVAETNSIFVAEPDSICLTETDSIRVAETNSRIIFLRSLMKLKDLKFPRSLWPDEKTVDLTSSVIFLDGPLLHSVLLRT